MEKTKSEIWHMIKYVLDIEDEMEIASWTKALLDLKEIQKKYGYPTSSILTIDDEVFITDSMAILPGRIHITSNRHDKYFSQNKSKPDLHILGDVTIEKCEVPIQVHGNVFCKDLTVNGEFSPEKFVNIGHVTINCETFNCDDVTVSGEIHINAKKIISTEMKANKISINGNVEACTFLNADNLTVSGNVDAKFINGVNSDKIQAEINQHFDPKKSSEDYPNGIYGND